MALYSSVNNEVLTGEIHRVAADSGCSVYYPKVIKEDEKDLIFVKVDTNDSLRMGRYGILEPSGKNRLVDFNLFDIVVVPGIAFDRKCNRIGYGKGMYDRVLNDVNCLIVGLAFDFQMVDSIQSEPHDVCMTAVLTESCVAGNLLWS